MTLLWYVHHHGLGHWRRALAVANCLEQPVILASSALPPAPLPANAGFAPLPTDAPGDDAFATAGGRLHWAPLRHPGLLERHRLLLELAASASAAVVDVSVEVTVLLRVSGIPVTTVRLPGDRGDAPHGLAADLADGVVMPVPGSWGLAAAGVDAVGLVSMLARQNSPLDAAGPVVVVAGSGGGGLSAVSLAALRAVPGRAVVCAEGNRDVAPLLANASVVVGGTGLGTVADVAAAGRPFITVAAERPFGEQAATAAALASHEAAVATTEPRSTHVWVELLGRAAELGPLRADTGGAERFAALLDAV